ncbi:uncharacterized protein K452DRAFT_58310 [Aplosporella prunicola CBS 121167]|uniref:F-box domain-containing protein n=1 Tax=Aplosporella prunicola CBS 121167 TaxID=1176127 RepID=A0A6A6B9M6_9PEZI|nr:uncharacterized protein K452DRAFT_58310 [Aplosporella prunicola CBS 121167]KAF2139934.1 hypothetical protein K452DRAFT_58310 [Aplosporella prunicola CBS 121167]
MVLDRSRFTMLKKFSLSPCIRAHSGSAGAILSNWRLWQVEELKMDQTEFTSEEAFAEQLVENFTHLTVLSLPRSRITGVGIKRIITGLRSKHTEDPARCPGQLRRLNIDYCLDVSPDAVEWAKKQGVEISWKMYTVKPSGKKVRY